MIQTIKQLKINLTAMIILFLSYLETQYKKSALYKI